MIISLWFSLGHLFVSDNVLVCKLPPYFEVGCRGILVYILGTVGEKVEIYLCSPSLEKYMPLFYVLFKYNEYFIGQCYFPTK